VFVDMSAAAVQRRIKTAKRRRALTTAARLAAMKQEKEAGTPLERMYSIEGLALAIHASTRKVLRLVQAKKLPPPCRVVDGKPFWRAVVIEPALSERGITAPAVENDDALAALREARQKPRPKWDRRAYMRDYHRRRKAELAQ
jgi:hypothetical protein